MNSLYLLQSAIVKIKLVPDIKYHPITLFFYTASLLLTVLILDLLYNIQGRH